MSMSDIADSKIDVDAHLCSRHIKKQIPLDKEHPLHIQQAYLDICEGLI
jgi:hypothetical protein